MRIIPKNFSINLRQNLNKKDEGIKDEWSDLQEELKDIIWTKVEEIVGQIGEQIATSVEETVREDIARTMLFEMNLDMETVEEATGLTNEELQKLLNEVDE